MDNTVKDNRNNIVYGFLAALVDRGFVAEVQLSFLPVGHTHEDIDAFFSRIARQIKKKPCLTLGELEACILASTKKHLDREVQVNVQWIDNVVDVAAWILPSCHEWKEAKNPPLHIQWRKVLGKVCMFSRMSYADDQIWVPQYGTVFFRCPLTSVPPRYTFAKYRDTKHLRSEIDEFKEHMQVGTPTAYETWQEELKALDQKQQQLCPTCLDLSQKIADVRPKKGAGKKVFNEQTKLKSDLEAQITLHRASGCSGVQEVQDFPLLTRCQLPVLKPILVPISLEPKPVSQQKAKDKRKKKQLLEDFVHQQMFYKPLAGLKKRKNELCAGDLVAVLGPSRDEPYRLLKCVDFEAPYFRFQWLYQNTKYGWDLDEEIHEDFLGFATFLHWGFELKSRNLIREGDEKIIMAHDLMHGIDPEKEKKKKEVEEEEEYDAHADEDNHEDSDDNNDDNEIVTRKSRKTRRQEQAETIENRVAQIREAATEKPGKKRKTTKPDATSKRKKKNN